MVSRGVDCTSLKITVFDMICLQCKLYVNWIFSSGFKTSALPLRDQYFMLSQHSNKVLKYNGRLIENK